MVLALCSLMTAMAREDSGVCGPDVRWHIANDTLWILGTGPMYDFEEKVVYLFSSNGNNSNQAQSAKRLPSSPFRYFSEKVIVIEEGVTYVGSFAFQEQECLNSVILPSSLERIGEGAFEECYKLKSINIPEHVTVIDNRAFILCIYEA